MTRLCRCLLVILLLTTACAQDPSQPVWKLKLQSRVYAEPVVRGENFYVFSQAGEVFCGKIRTGEKKWMRKIPGAILGTPVISNDMLFLATQDGVIYALNPETGKEKWQKSIQDQFSAPLEIFSAGILVPSETGTLYALSRIDGSELWRFSGQKKITAKPLVAGNNILLGAWNKQFTSLKQDGSLNWNLTAAEMITDDPVMLNNLVLFSCYDRFIYAVEIPTGRLTWRFPAVRPSNLVLINEELIFASDKNLVFVSARSGKLQRTMKFGKTVSRIYAQNSNLFVVSKDVYRIKPVNATISRVIQGPYPIFKLNFGVGMTLASDDLYSIYGYGKSKD